MSTSAAPVGEEPAAKPGRAAVSWLPAGHQRAAGAMQRSSCCTVAGWQCTVQQEQPFHSNAAERTACIPGEVLPPPQRFIEEQQPFLVGAALSSDPSFYIRTRGRSGWQICGCVLCLLPPQGREWHLQEWQASWSFGSCGFCRAMLRQGWFQLLEPRNVLPLQSCETQTILRVGNMEWMLMKYLRIFKRTKQVYCDTEKVDNLFLSCSVKYCDAICWVRDPRNTAVDDL